MTSTSVPPVAHPYTDVDHTTFGQNAIMIEMAYNMGRPFQWAREFAFNSIEANATLVSFTADFVTARERGIYRRMIADNGSGMTRAGLADCINKIGGGNSARGGGSAANLGQGAKVASAYFNPAGVVYLTRTPEDGDAIAIYVRDSDSGDYGLLRTYGLDDLDRVVRRSIHRPQRLFLDEAGLVPFDEGTDWEAVMDEAFCNLGNPESGCAVVFMGDGTNDTFLGDPERETEATKYGLPRYLESRIWSVPETVKIRLLEFRVWTDKSEWPTSEEDTSIIPAKSGEGRGNLRRQWRYIKGLQEHLYDPAFLVDSGEVTVVSTDGIPAKIDWVITKFASTLKGGGERGDKSSTEINPGGIGTIMAVSAASKRGFYDVMDFVAEGAANTRFQHFGVDAASVQQQLWMTISPAVYRPADRVTGDPLVPGVGMDGSRSHIVSYSASRPAEPIETILKEWGKDFQSDAKFPPQIRALLDAAWATHTGATSVLDEKTTARIAEALKGALTRQIALVTKKKPTTTTEGGGGFRSRRRGRKPNPDPKPGPREPGGAREGGTPGTGDKAAKKTTSAALLPEVRWVPADNRQWHEDEYSGAIAMLRLPGTPGAGEGGTVWLKGTDPDVEPTARTNDGGVVYATQDARFEDESPVILAAVQDKQAEYGPAQHWQVEKAVKGSYVASAQAVAAHLIAEGGWDPVAKEWNPIGGVTPEMMKAAIQPFNLSNAVRGYYPQKAMAAGYLGSLTKKIRAAKAA